MTLIHKDYSINFTKKKRKSKNIKYLIFHYTGMKNEEKAIDRLKDAKSKVSSHYLIKKNGQIILLVPPSYIAWHAGVSSWKRDKFLNNLEVFSSSTAIIEGSLRISYEESVRQREERKNKKRKLIKE